MPSARISPPTRRLTTLGGVALFAALSACASSSTKPPEPTHPAAPVAPTLPDVTSDRGDRVLAPSPVGRLAPEDAPVPPGTRR